MSNLHIEAYLDDYRKMSDADFAVMITGSWGCGKSWFITNYLKQKCIVKGKNEYVYISLNGISKTSEIDMAIFQAVHPVLGSKAMVTLGKVLMASIKAGIKLDMDITGDKTPDMAADIDPSQALPSCDFSIKSKSKLFVFDDLERCLLKPAEILGYVNAFVESKESKVILVGEERWLTKSNEDSHYGVIKEKVVGKTFKITETIEEIIDSLIQKQNYPRTIAIIDRNKSKVIEIFKKVASETEAYNYRALKHSLRDFEYFYSFIDERFTKNDVFLDELFAVFITLDYELQLAHYTIEKMQSLATPVDAAGKQIGDTPPFAVVLKRHNIYCHPIFRSTDSLILDLDVWQTIFKNEPLDKLALTEAIGNNKYFVNQSRPEWVQLWHWHNLSDKDADHALNSVQEKLTKYEYTVAEIVLHVFLVLYDLASIRAISETQDEIKAKFKTYVKALEEQSSLSVHNPLMFTASGHGDFGLAYRGIRDGTVIFSEWMEPISRALNVVKEKEITSKIESWTGELSIFPGNFYLKLDDSGDFYDRPILHHFDARSFTTIYVDLVYSTRNTIVLLLEKRYAMNGKHLLDELVFVQDVVAELKRRLELFTSTTPSSFSLNWALNKFLEFEKLLVTPPKE